MNFYENYYKTGCSIKSKAARAEFYTAILEYFYEGTDPEFKCESAKIAYTAIFPSLDKQRKGRMKRLGRTAEANDKQTISKTEATRKQSGTDAEEVVSSKQEVVSNSPNGEFPLNPPSFALQCLGALNRVLGTPYSSLPSECLHTLERFEGTYSVDDVEAMIRVKYDEWHEDAKMRAWLTPHTLFKPEKFEKYMIQSSERSREVSDHARYD